MTKTMLIVDDEPKIVQSCRNYRTAAGFNVVRAETGPTGLATARQDRPDWIVLDLLLPGMDGLDVCRHFRQDPLLSNIPIIVLTARVEETGNART